MGVSRPNDHWAGYCNLDYRCTSLNCDSKKLTRCHEWYSITVNARALHQNFLDKLRQERGNVESSLVLIPLIFLFLIAVEPIVATNLRNSEFSLAQSDASSRAISGVLTSSDQVIELNSPDSFTHMKLLITNRRHSLPKLVPGLVALFGGNAVVDVKGVAVMENIN
jgi:fructose-bisphosphate aldolase class 1